MGLSTASARHPHVMVMAPALIKVSKSHENFNLSPHIPNTEVTAPIKTRDDCSIYRSLRSTCNGKTLEFNTKEDLNLALVSELFKNNGAFLALGEDDTNPKYHNFVMNGSSPHMGDQTDDKMCIQKAGLEVSTFFKEKNTNNDMDQLFNNLPVEADISQNMDELIQVIKSIESAGDKLNSTGNDLGPESDTMFQLSGTDLTSNLSPFEKELLNDVDVMNITMEEQFIEGAKENHSKELLKELEEKEVQLRRRLDFLIRRLRKTQAKHMGQHVSEETAGIFEHVHRTLRRIKEPISGDSNNLNSIASERLKPISQSSAKNLIRKLEMSANIQANASARRQSSQYFGSGSVETSSIRSALLGATTIPQWTPECKSDLEKVVGSLHAESRLLQDEIDSEATLSSSGAESCDEMQTYSNSQQQYLSIEKRAAWKYATERAAIASRWSWLQAQIPDLEYRIRQYSELHKQIRMNKGAVQFGGSSPPHSEPTSPSAVNGYRGQLPGASPLSFKNMDSDRYSSVPQSDGFCSRTRPLINFRKRKLLQTWGLHAVSKKAARSSTIRCGCVPPSFQCALCTGRTDPTRPRDLSDHLSKSERVSLLDPAFHPVFSLNEDISTSTHLEAIMKTSEWQHRSTRPSLKSVKFITKSERIDKNCIGMDQPKKQYTDHRKKYSRLLKSTTISALTAKLKHKFRGRKPGLHSLARLKRNQHVEKLALAQLSSSAVESGNEDIDPCGLSNSSTKTESRSSSPLLPMQSLSGFKRNNRISSYDIDNIVIPYSVAAATRVERLQYKEILTPKWRLVEPDFTSKYPDKNNGSVKDAEQSDSENEDISEEAVNIRHDKCQQDERKKFLRYLKFPYGSARARSHKRTDSRAESSGGNSPDQMSPQPSDTIENIGSPIIASPPATPLSVITDEHLPSISILRRRTMIQSLRGKDKEIVKEEVRSTTPEAVEVAPYEWRTFPLCDDTYDKMLKLMPEDHQFQTNIRSQDCMSPINNFMDGSRHSHDSESTESAIGDEDPNDPEWLDMER